MIRHIYILFLFPIVLFQNCDRMTVTRAGVEAEGRNSPSSRIAGKTCLVDDLASLRSCQLQAQKWRIIEITNDLSCSGEECCSGENALILLSEVSDVKIRGGGHTLTRHAGHRQCSAIQIHRSQSIAVENFSIDEDLSQTACQPEDHCPGTVNVWGSQDVSFDNVNVRHAKNLGFDVFHTDGFSLLNSAVVNSGVIGVYVGNGSYDANLASNHIVIANSIIARSRTNGVVLQGVWGAQFSDNRIENNIFSGNHYQGLWPAGDGTGRAVNGGQIYLPNVRNLTVANNTITSGFCASCNNPMVMGIELGYEGPIRNVTIEKNLFIDSYGAALYLNRDPRGLRADIDSSTGVHNNTVKGFTEFLLSGTDRDIGAATIGANAIEATPFPPRSAVSGSVIFRMVSGGVHFEATRSDERVADAIEGRFGLRIYPASRLSAVPLWRCSVRGSHARDYLSFDRLCEGQSVAASLAGYSYQEGEPGTQAFYRCRQGDDHFISWDSNCEGQTNEGRLGFAIPL